MIATIVILEGGDVGEEGPGGGGAVGRDGARGHLQAAARVHEPFVILEEGAVAVEFRGNRRCYGYAFQCMTSAEYQFAEQMAVARQCRLFQRHAFGECI